MLVNRYRYFVNYSEETFTKVNTVMFTRYDNVTRTCVYVLNNSGDTISAPLSIEDLEALVSSKKLFEVEVRTFNSYPKDNPHPIFVLYHKSGFIQVLYFCSLDFFPMGYEDLSEGSVRKFLESDLQKYTEVDINEKIRLEKLHLFIHQTNPLKQIVVSEYRLRAIKQMYEEKGPSLSKCFIEVPLGYIVIDDAFMNNTFIQMYL